MDTYEITVVCVDQDWVSRRIRCRDFHEAATAALSWINMASIRDGDKLYGARLLSILRMPAVTAATACEPSQNRCGRGARVTGSAHKGAE
jgi:hypothetical protein